MQIDRVVVHIVAADEQFLVSQVEHGKGCGFHVHGDYELIRIASPVELNGFENKLTSARQTFKCVMDIDVCSTPTYIISVILLL